jgi:prepilin-type N-terminal cleavage/methylation domain-containing protein
MGIKFKNRGAEKGFTTIELIVVMGIMAILAGIAIPMFSVMIPDYKLKQAAQDLYSNMQNAKMEAVRTNGMRQIIIRADSYQKTDGTTVTLASYGHGIIFGKGNATDMLGISEYTEPNNLVQFNERGMGLTEGCVYLTNSKKTAFAVCSRLSGVVTIRKWVGGWR